MNKDNNTGDGSGDCCTTSSHRSSPLQPPPLLLLSEQITMTDDARCSDSVVQTNDISTNVVISNDHFSSAKQTTLHSTGGEHGDTDLSNSVTQWYQRSEDVCNNRQTTGTETDDICHRNCNSGEDSPTDDVILDKQCYQTTVVNAVDISRTVRDTDVDSSGESVIKSCNYSSKRDDCRSANSIEKNDDKTMQVSRNSSAENSNVKNKDKDLKRSYYFPITSTEINSILMDPEESPLNAGSNFGESHVNKLMSFVDSLDRHESLVKKSPNYAAIQSAIGAITMEKHPVGSVKELHAETLYKPYAKSPSSGFPSVRTNNYHSDTPEPASLNEPLDLSLNREGSENKFSDKRNSGLIGDDFQYSLDRLRRVAQNSNESSKFDTGINNEDSISRPIEPSWRFGVGAHPENSDWSQATSSLSSLQAQMEAVIMSYPIFRAGMQYCNDMFTPMYCDNVKPDISCSKSNRDSKISIYASDLHSPRANQVELADDPVRHSRFNNQKQQKYLSKLNRSTRNFRNSKPLKKLSYKHSPISTNLTPMRIQSVVQDFEKADYENNRETYTTSGRSNNVSGDFSETRRPLTSLSCSCRRQFSTLYQLTVHMKKTGHGPSITGADFAEDFPKLVRGQDLWMSLGQAQKDRTLSCMRCHASFQSLPELTVHMVKTKHYVDIVGHENCEPTQKLLNGESNQKLYDSEILLKLETALINERNKGTMFAKMKSVCKQCLSSFSDADALSEHLFVTGHQMLVKDSKKERGSPSERSYFTDDSCDDCKSAETGHSLRKISLERKPTPNRGPPNLLSITHLEKNKSPKSVIFKKQKLEETISRRYNGSSSSKSFSSDFPKQEKSHDTKFDQNVTKHRNKNLDKGFITANGEVLQNSAHLSPNKGMNLKRQLRKDSETRKYKRSKLEHSEERRLPFEMCLSSSDDNKSWERDAINQTALFQSEHGSEINDQNPTIKEIVKNNFTEFICPSEDTVDSSSTLKAMENFVERSFLFTNYFATVNDTPALQSNPLDTKICGDNLSQRNSNLFSQSAPLSSHSLNLSSRSPHSKEVEKHGGRVPKTISINTSKFNRFLSNTSYKLSSSSIHSYAAQRRSPKKHELPELKEQRDFQDKETERKSNDSCISRSHPRNSPTVLECNSSLEDNKHKGDTVSNVLSSNTKPVNNSSITASNTSINNKSERVTATDSKLSVQKSYTSSTLQFIQLLVDDTISNTSQTQLEDGSLKMNVPDVGKVGIAT